MESNKFIRYSADANNPKWDKYISRLDKLYKKGKDIRSESERDYNRIIHCTAYRRLKHKTQVFFAPYADYTKLIIKKIYDTLVNYYQYYQTRLNDEIRLSLLRASFDEWIDKYCLQRNKNYNNKVIYNLDNKTDYKRAVIDYISGMTDQFAIKIFNEINSF